MRLGPAEAAIFETFVVPRYLSLFGELALEMIAEGDDAQVVHMHCRTGYPDRGLAIRLPGAYVVGVDASSAALELARAKAATMPGLVSDYRLVDELPTPLPEAAFSHALTLHPLASAEDRGPLLAESARLLAPHGQALLAMPLRGSFQEIFDLLREYALKYDDTDVAAAVEQAVLVRPTVETLSAELERRRVRLRRRIAAPVHAALPGRARLLRGPGRAPRDPARGAAHAEPRSRRRPVARLRSRGDRQVLERTRVRAHRERRLRHGPPNSLEAPRANAARSGGRRRKRSGRRRAAKAASGSRRQSLTRAGGMLNRLVHR